MITEPRCPDSLVVRARYGSLSSIERARCDAHLAQCVDCQVALLVGRDFDRATATQSGDDALIARMAERASSAMPAAERRPTAHRYRGLLLVAALMAITAGAAAATWSFTRPPVVESAPIAPAPIEAVAPPPIVVAPVVAPPVPVVVEPPSVPAPHAERAAVVPDAATLFARANAHRRAGEVRAAIDDYRVLQRTYARSAEALVSHVVLGSLLLERSHDPTGALRQFDRYLGQDAHRDLTEEALYGRGRALERLGRTDDERETWHRLLERFPASAYSPRARERLAVLE